MFQLLPCSRCQRTFSVRSEISDQALLKCPNCGNQFRLGELLDAFYAPWEILENPGMAAAGSPASVAQAPAGAAPAALTLAGSATESSAAESSGAVAASTSEHGEHGLSLDGPDLELADEEEASSSGISLQSAGKAKPKTDWSNYKPITHEEFQRMKRADRSPFWSTLQVVLGGAAAIPVSLLLIWHVLDKDVAGAGPAVARYVPWIVPEKFRGFEPAELSVPAEPARIPRRGESGFRNFDDVMPPAESGSDDSTGSAQPDEAPAGDETVVASFAEADDRSAIAASETAATEPDASEPDAGEANASKAVATEADASKAQASNGIANEPTRDVFVLLKRTKDKVDGWKEVATAKDTVKREAAISLFEDLASLGVLLSSIPDTQGAPALIRDRAQEISRTIKRQPDLTEVLHSAAKAQLNGNLPRSKDGWVLVCTVGEMFDEGDWWRITVADPTLLRLDVPKIEIPKSIAPQPTVGQRLLLLGRFIAPPVDASVVESQPSEATATEKKTEESAPAPETFRASFSYGL